MESALHVAPRHPSRDDTGYSLIEIMVVIAIMGTMLALGVGSFRAWALAKDHEGTASDLQTMLRQTQTRAITEGVSFCVTFDTSGQTYTINRYACGTPTVKVNGPITVQDPRVHLADVRFLYPDGSTSRDLTFRPTGTATPGRVVVERDGSLKTYTVSVEGFTGRVSIA